MPEVPQTLEGWYCLHDFRRIDWPRWKALPDDEREAIAEEAREFLLGAEEARDAPEGASALYTIVGHKADLMFIHLRPRPDDLHALEYGFARRRLADFTSQPYSYFSVAELSFQEAKARGAAENPREAPFVRARLYPSIPEKRYVTFYPMNKRRGEQLNWFMLPAAERAAMMKSHGNIGHKYHGVVQQLITGSTGLDDWEWGVTLWTEDPLQFKKLVYEMRFDEVSAKYAEFGPFVLGIRLRPDDFQRLLGG